VNDVTDSYIEKTKKEQEIENQLKKDVVHYRNVMNYLGCNVPIQVMCLPPEIEKILLKEGFLRVYDLIGHDLTKIKGIGESRRAILEDRLDGFFSISI
jgi:hypothetical protein